MGYVGNIFAECIERDIFNISLIDEDLALEGFEVVESADELCDGGFSAS